MGASEWGGGRFICLPPFVCQNVCNVKRIRRFISAERVAWIAVLAASPAYVLCRWTHFCMGGHLPDHGDLGHSHKAMVGYALDSAWAIAFALAVVMSFLSGITFRYSFIFALGVGFLFLTDPHGLSEILAWPVHAALCLFAIACWKGWID